MPRVKGALGRRSFSAKPRTVLEELGWLVILLRAIHPSCKDPDPPKQAGTPEGNGTFSAVEGSLVFACGLTDCFVLDLWIHNSGLKNVCVLSLSSVSSSRGSMKIKSKV